MQIIIDYVVTSKQYSLSEIAHLTRSLVIMFIQSNIKFRTSGKSLNDVNTTQ